MSVHNLGKHAKDCADILKANPSRKGYDGVYTIYPSSNTWKKVFCDMTTEGGGWTVSRIFLMFPKIVNSLQVMTKEIYNCPYDRNVRFFSQYCNLNSIKICEVFQLKECTSTFYKL